MIKLLQYLLYESFHLWIGTGIRFFFRNTYRINKKNLKQFTPTIFVGNHENALLDALMVITGSHRQPYSMTRSDVFKKPLVRAFLYTIRMLPVYRQRDGRENMRKNIVIFNRVTEVLTKKRSVLIFPEGDQSLVHRLRALKKGVFRFSFPAEEKTNWKTGVHMLPVGLVYSDHFKVHKDFILNVGDPIYLRDYREEYEDQPEKAIESLRIELAKAMSKGMLDIHTKEYYDDHLFLRSLYLHIVCDKHHKPQIQREKFLLGQVFSQRLNQLENVESETNSPFQKAAIYRSSLDELGIREETVRRSPNLVELIFRTALLVIALPLYAFALAVNYFPMKYAEGLANKIVKSPKFLLTMRFAMGLSVYTVLCILFFVSGFLLFNHWIGGLISAFLLLFSIPIYFDYKQEWKRYKSYWKWYKLDLKKKSGVKKERAELIDWCDQLMKD